MNLIRPPSTELLQFLTGYVTLRCDLDLLTSESCHVMPLGGQSVYQVWTGYDLPFQSQDDYNFPLTASLKSQFLRLGGGLKGSNSKFNLSNPQKALAWRKRRIMTYWALGCVQKCDLWAWRRNEKKNRNFHASNCPDHPRRRRPLKFCMRGPGSSYIFQVSWKSVEGSPSCGG